MEAPKEIYTHRFLNGNWSQCWEESGGPGKTKYIRADLAELTVGDMCKIREIMFDYNAECRRNNYIPYDEDYCEEVLRRFNEQRYK